MKLGKKYLSGGCMQVRTALISFLFLMSFLFLINQAEGKASELKVVFVKKVEKKELFNLLAYPTKVLAKKNSRLLAEAEGVIEEIKVNLGDKVSKGTPLLIIKNTDPVYQFRPLKLKAPIDGVIAEIHETLGSMVNKGKLLITITDPTEYQMRFNVTATDLKRLKKGMSGTFSPVTFDATTKPLKVSILGISPLINPTTGTAQAELEINSDLTSLPPTIGSMGNVQFKVDSHKGIMIREDAIFYYGKKTYAYVLENEKVKKVEITLGQKSLGQIEVLTGLLEGQTLIEKYSEHLQDGEKVKVVKNTKGS